MDADGTFYWPTVNDNEGCMQWQLCPVWKKLLVCDTCHKKLPIDAKVHHHGQNSRCDQCERYLKEKADGR
jgi:hypothetical protein